MTAPRTRAAAAKRRARAPLLVLLVLLVCVPSVGVYAVRGLYRSAEDRYIRVALPLRSGTRDLALRMVDEETGVRGYLITGDRRSLAPYFAGRRGANADLVRLRRLTRDRPHLAARLAVLRREIRALHAFYDRSITFVADSRRGLRRAREEVLGDERLFARFRHTSSLMQGDIDRLVADARATQRVTYHRAVGTLAAAGAVAVLIAAMLLVTVPERLRRLYAAEEDARRAAEQGANAAQALRHVSDAVVLLDEAGTIRFWNAAAERLFGVSAADAVGRLGQEMVPGYARLVEAGRRWDAFVSLRVGDEEAWIAPARSTFDGGSVLTLTDVSALHRLERARADFVTTASHELRTPLTAIYGGARTLLARDEQLSPDQRERLLRLIEQESAQLARIVEQLLVTAQLERGGLTTAAQQFDARALCESVVASAGMRGGPDAELVLDAPQGVEPIVGDETLLRQVLGNLVENALKYSPEHVRVVVRLRGDRDALRIHVRDEGLGIPPSEQERIFEKFYRLDADMARGVGGSGLGLYISRELVERMGGRLTVRSAPSQGSTFTVELPRRVDRPARDAPAPGRAA